MCSYGCSWWKARFFILGAKTLLVWRTWASKLSSIQYNLGSLNKKQPMFSGCSQTVLSKAYIAPSRTLDKVRFISIWVCWHLTILIIWYPRLKTFGKGWRLTRVLLFCQQQLWPLVPINSKLLHVLHCFNRFCLNLSK